MKVGVITKTNKKGQIVIPKEFRKALRISDKSALNITLADTGIFIHTVDEVLTETERENAYLELLKTTKGAWSNDNWDKTEKKRKKIEQTASAKRKKQW